MEKNLSLNDTEIKAILDLLAQCQYAQVYRLIAKIQDQVRTQEATPA